MMGEIKSIEFATLSPFDKVLESLNDVSTATAPIVASANDAGKVAAKEREQYKKYADNIKIGAKVSSSLEKFTNMGKEVLGVDDAFQFLGAAADFGLGVKGLEKGLNKENIINADSAKGALYLGSSGAKLANIFKGGKAWGVLGGLCKIGRGLFDCFGEQDPEKPYQIEGAVCDIASGLADIAAKLVPSLTIFFTSLSCTFMIAAGFFKDGKWLEGVLTLIIGTIVSTAIGIVFKAVLKTAFQALMKTIMSAFNLTASPLATNPITAVAALAIIILISTLLAQALSNILGFAQGGFPVHGQPFIAREAGPELVGTLNGRNAVVNNNQIVEAVSHGVYNAFQSALYNSSSKASAIAKVYLDSKLIAMAG